MKPPSIFFHVASSADYGRAPIIPALCALRRYNGSYGGAVNSNLPGRTFLECGGMTPLLDQT
jgi:hypothetical protein